MRGVQEILTGEEAGVPKSNSSVSPRTNVLLLVNVTVPFVVEALNIGTTFDEFTFACTFRVPAEVTHCTS